MASSIIEDTMNETGQDLAAIIRAGCFVSVHHQERMYQSYWQPMQNSLKDNMTEFIRHFLMKEGSVVKQGEVYFALKDRAADKHSQEEVISYLEEIAKFASHYAKLVDPDNEHSFRLRTRLKRLNRIEVTTAYPFLLNAYNDYSQNLLPEDRFEELLIQFPRFIGRDRAKFRTCRQLKNGAFIETHLSAAAIRSFCIQATTQAGLDTDDWRVEFE